MVCYTRLAVGEMVFRFQLDSLMQGASRRAIPETDDNVVEGSRAGSFDPADPATISVHTNPHRGAVPLAVTCCLLLLDRKLPAKIASGFTIPCAV